MLKKIVVIFFWILLFFFLAFYSIAGICFFSTYTKFFKSLSSYDKLRQIGLVDVSIKHYSFNLASFMIREHSKEELFKRIDHLYIRAVVDGVRNNNFYLLDWLVKRGHAMPLYFEFRRDNERLHHFIAINLNNIKSYSHFISEFPDSKYTSEFKHNRRMQYLSANDLKRQNINIDSFLTVHPCYIPFLKVLDDSLGRLLTIDDVVNDSTDNPMLKYRYIVEDLNTIGHDGKCKGVVEQFPVISKLNDFTLIHTISVFHSLSYNVLAEMDSLAFLKLLPSSSIVEYAFAEKECLKNYLDQVESYRKKLPMTKKPDYLFLRRKFCSGQSMCLCEIHGDTIVQDARFISSGKGDTYFGFNAAGLKHWFYGSINIIRSRFWSRDRHYTTYDRKRDRYMGGGMSGVCIFYETKCELPNFLGFVPIRKYPHACRGNGIHEFAVGPFLDALMGTPSSLGCLRLYDYPAKFTRWWTPMYAKLFISFDENKVKQLSPIPKTKEEIDQEKKDEDEKKKQDEKKQKEERLKKSKEEGNKKITENKRDSVKIPEIIHE